MATNRICSIPNCCKPVFGHGWCNMHYLRWRKHGDPLEKLTAANGEPERYLREVVLPYDGDECLVWPFGRLPSGYGRLGDGYAHRRICEEFKGPPPTPEHEAAHSCGNEGCVTKRHLSWKTHAENEADKLIHGTHNRGERHVSAKLTESEARQILALKGAETQRLIADRFNVSQSLVSLIHSKVAWWWLEQPEGESPCQRDTL